MRSVRNLAVVLVIAAAPIAGCTAGPAPQPTTAPPPASATARPDDTFDQLAQRDVGKWPSNLLAGVWKSSFLPLQSATVVPVAYRSVTDDSSAVSARRVALAAIAHRFVLGVRSLPAGPDHGTIAFPDGATMPVPVESALDAFQAAAASVHETAPACPDARGTGSDSGDEPCSLTVTQIAYGTTTLLTSRGEARVPAWIFTVKQLAGAVARVAVPTSAWMVTHIPVGDRPSPDGVNGVESLLSVDRSTITYTVLTGACDDDTKARVYETPTAVVIGATHTQKAGYESCSGAGAAKTTTVTLAAPLGTRPLLDVDGGNVLVIGVKPGQSIS